ncbi:MAG: nucleoside kinase [Salinivirgaceae bacterium]|nr:nucleoside kinase [Salinivirgaceae bacterium]MDD4746244.1 nucleoside kinase [Salinivirgaceae bacterium]MDY0280565.1 nucleoside kinase [Salinivirgaceae bacterium]
MIKQREIEVIIQNTDQRHKFPLGTSLDEIIAELKIKLKYPIIGAMVNNKLKELDYAIFKPKTIKFIDLTHPDGMRMYVRSLSFILIRAAKNLFPNRRLTIEHSVSNGYYCEFEGDNKELSIEDIIALQKEMRLIIDSNFPFVREEILTEEAIALFEKHGSQNKADLFKTRKLLYTSVYILDGVPDYFYGYLAPSTAYINIFDLYKYYNGMLLRVPTISNPDQVAPIVIQDKMFEIFQEHKRWNEIIKVDTVGQLNQATENGTISDLIMVSEALQEKKMAAIADLINDRNPMPRIILISGPTSSGKTTSAKRLEVQLKVLGIFPQTISLDNYFVNRIDTPKDKNGEYDFENIKALDIALFNKQLLQLLKGEEVEVPRFNFGTGERFYAGDFLHLDSKSVLVIEGIHALNPLLTNKIPSNAKFKVYVSALTALCMDEHNRIPTTDNRLIRRIVRDHQYRGYSAQETIKRWPSVRRGEEKYIFPFQEEADVMYNSALLFELGVLKQYAEPILREVSPKTPEYAEAARLLKFFTYLSSIPEKEIPPTSILREFLFGSSFRYH